MFCLMKLTSLLNRLKGVEVLNYIDDRGTDDFK